MTSFAERTYQTQATDDCVDYLVNDGYVLLQAPTGSGKTYISGRICATLKQKHNVKRILFVVNRQALVSQSWDTLDAVELSKSVLHNDIKRHPSGFMYDRNHTDSEVVITMVETFWNEHSSLPKDFYPDLIVLDEAHKATSSQYQKLRKTYPNAKLLGLTATPARMQNLEGESLREWYGNNLVLTISLKELIDQGFLVRPEYMEYSSDGHIVNDWLAYTSATPKNRRTIMFCEDTRHMIQVHDAFRKAGIAAAMITTTDEYDGVTILTPNQRNRIFADYRANRTEVLVTVNALCEGFDEPLAQYCVMLRNVRSTPLYHQMVGRVLRWHKSKLTGKVIDYYTNIERMGWVEDYEWDLDDENQRHIKVKKDGEISSKQWEKHDKVYVTCSSCNHVYDIKAQTSCVHCGQHNIIKKRATIKWVRDQLFAEISPRYVKQVAARSSEQRAFNEVIAKIKIAQQRRMGDQMNQMLCAEIFDDDDFSSKYSVLYEVIKRKNWKMDDVVYYT